ncbi:MAG: hypothetical protein CME60_08915 [Halobacteriovoraceae bacterium]|nr:hypothetical protein [Halobacteriovoraceae bacterium]
MKKNIFIILSILYSTLMSVWAAEVAVQVIPEQPVKGEVFDVKFKVTLTTNDKPYISFTPVNLEVLERVNEPEYHFEIRGGIGRAKTTKTLTYTYKMVANRGGTSYLRDILVEVGKEKVESKTVRIKVLSERKEMPKIFARAEVSSDEAYLGEGIDVRYYTYSLYPIIQTEIKQFPKLNGFIKRFHKPVDTEEAVRVDGKVYRRSLKYSARIYPEKTGDLTIDPLRMVVQYAGGSVNPFGNLGFGFNRFKKKNLSSKRVKIKIKPLPTDGLISSFTGLVGEHEFKLTMNKNKYLVNEAIEARLEVSGPGALEKLEAPKLFTSEALEKFDDKSDFQELGESRGRKVFEYTYLARANVEIPERILKLGYFDPETSQYKEVEVVIPSLKIGGGSSNIPSKNTTSNAPLNENLGNDRIFKEVPSPSLMSAPLFDTSWKSIPLDWVKYLSFILTGLILVQTLLLLKGQSKKIEKDENLYKIYKRLLKKGIDYKDLVSMIFMLRSSNSNNADLIDIIESSSMKDSDKSYFSKMIRQIESGSYSKTKGRVDKKMKVSSLKDLKNAIEKKRLEERERENGDESLKLDSRTT